MSFLTRRASRPVTACLPLRRRSCFLDLLRRRWLRKEDFLNTLPFLVTLKRLLTDLLILKRLDGFFMVRSSSFLFGWGDGGDQTLAHELWFTLDLANVGKIFPEPID